MANRHFGGEHQITSRSDERPVPGFLTLVLTNMLKSIVRYSSRSQVNYGFHVMEGPFHILGCERIVTETTRATLVFRSPLTYFALQPLQPHICMLVVSPISLLHSFIILIRQSRSATIIEHVDRVTEAASLG